jgi:cation:H+ antiporter
MLIQVVLYILSFIVIWFGAGVVVSSVDRISHKLNLSSFAVSFFVLGLLTSIPEISVGINSVIQHDPDIYVGNLIGGIVVIFLLIIPLLALFGNGVKLVHQMEHKNLIFALLVIAAPSIFALDGRISSAEGIFSIVLYAVLVYIVEKKKGLFEQVKDKLLDGKSNLLDDTLKILGGVVVIFFASKFVVDRTIYFSGFFHVSEFLLSLIVVSLGTNLPELSLVARSLAMKKKEVAFGDYLGSAAANTLIFGGLVLLGGGSLVVINNFLTTFIMLMGGLWIFFLFARTKNDISKKEGVVLLGMYIFFLLIEFLFG